MLVKLLSGKSFFAQIILGILFTLLFFIKKQTLSFDWQSITGIFLFFISIFVSLLFYQNSPLIKHQGLVVWYFLIWMLCFSEISLDFKLSAALLMSTLLFWRLIVADQSPENTKFLFDVGILLSISGFFFPPGFLLFGFLLFLFIYMRSVTLKGFILFLIGISLPLIVGVQLLYLIGQIEWINSYQSAFCMDYWDFPIWGLVPIGLLIILSWLDHLAQSATQDINKRQKYFLNFLYFTNWVIILILFAGENTDALAFLGLPLAIFLTRFTQYQKSNTVKEVLLWLYLATMLGFYFWENLLEIYEDLLGNVAF